jgi:hypothetical protein
MTMGACGESASPVLQVVVPTSTAKPVPTTAPIPTAKPVPTTAPTPTATPMPTAAPIPTATPMPTAAPIPTATPMPTAAPIPTATPTPAGRVPTITILNATNFSTEEIRIWTQVATANLSYTAPDILGVIWSIGSVIGTTGEVGAPFNKYTQVRDSSELKSTADAFDAWVDAAGCTTTDAWRAVENQELKERVRVWIEGSYDAATAPEACLESRTVTVGASSEQSKDTVQRIYLHETYHALQVALYEGHCYSIESYQGESGPRPDPIRDTKSEAGRWFAEGTAEYFAHVTQAQIKGNTNGVQLMLAAAGAAANESKDLNEGIATSGSAAVRLLVERGVITEDQILNASLFKTCDWVDTFGAAVPEVIHAKANWHQLQNLGGTWGFTAAALQP